MKAGGKEEAARLLSLAERDLDAFEALIAVPCIHISIIGFHAQQYVEKVMKAALVARGAVFHRTHNLMTLAQLLKEHGETLPVDEELLKKLNPFAVVMRYTDIEIVFEQIDAQKIVSAFENWANEKFGT